MHLPITRILPRHRQHSALIRHKLHMKREQETYGICGFLFFIPLFISGGLRLVGLALLIAQSLPLLSKQLANLA